MKTLDYVFSYVSDKNIPVFLIRKKFQPWEKIQLSWLKNFQEQRNNFLIKTEQITFTLFFVKNFLVVV